MKTRFGISMFSAALAVLSLTAHASNDEDMIQIGGEVSAGRQVSGPEIGTIIGVQIFGKRGDAIEGTETRYLWVKGEVLLGGEDESLPFVDLEIIPLSALSLDETEKMRQTVIARALTTSYRRDIGLDVDHSIKISLVGITVGGEWKLAGKNWDRALSAFAQISIDVAGFAYATMHSTGDEYRRLNIGEFGGELGLGYRLGKRVNLRMIAAGIEGYSFSLKAKGDYEGEEYDNLSLMLADLYTELSATLDTAVADITLFARGGQNSGHLTYSLSARGERYDFALEETKYKFLRIGFRITL